MSNEVPNLPNDLATCHKMIVGLIATVEAGNRRIAALEYQLDKWVKQHYGPRSERMDPNQIALFENGALPEQAATAPDDSGRTPQPRKNGHGRRRLPRDLPRKRITHPVRPEDLVCPECGGEKKQIGEEVSEQFEYIPSSVWVIEHVRPKFACPCCQGHVTVALKPYQPIEKGLPGPGMLAHVVVSKFADHLPLHRQESILRRQGVDVSRSTMCGWMRAVADLLEPLYAVMKAEVLRSKVIHTDDTPVPVQDPSSPGKTKTGRLWVYLGDRVHPYSVFDYTPTRSRDGPVQFLTGYKGYLQADAFGGYDGIFAGGDVTEVACMAHARRKFFEARTTNAAGAAEALARIRMLYEVEETAKHLSAELRREMRQRKSVPLLADLGRWLEAQTRVALPKSPLGGAVQYAQNNWMALNRYVEDGDLDIDNNAAERALRGVAVGRKNWLFAGSDRGGRTAAVLYTFVGSAKLHQLDPFDYLRDVIDRISGHPSSRIGEFMPDQWKALRQKAALEACAAATTPATDSDGAIAPVPAAQN